ncbi:hypothetical protein AB0H97_00980 [Streptomyces sp. NPDC050788]|uniref:hypothetical protein n=1 Tax=Streptomyces sp. NPDC050788 TaxID=3155041 RepID=UPI0034384677
MAYGTGRAVQEAEQRVAEFRSLAKADPGTYEPELALALYALCQELRDTQAFVTAAFLERCDEAIALHRRLLGTNPASYPQLGILLGWRGFAEYRRGGHQQAVAFLEESVSLLRVVVRRIPGGKFDRQLPRALALLAYALQEVQDHAAALSAARECVSMWRELDSEPPYDVDGGLVGALHTLCQALQGAGRQRDTLGPAEESVAISRVRLAANPGLDEERLLANGLDLQVAALVAHERWEEARAPALEAVRLYAHVHRRGDHRGSVNYASARVNYAILLHHAGQISDAKYEASMAGMELLRRARDASDPAGAARVASQLAGLMNDLGMKRRSANFVAKMNARLQPRPRGRWRLFSNGRA